MTDLCPNKSVCGSCAWSDILYSEQLDQKLRNINLAFTAHDIPAQVSEIAPSPKTEHYRNRMDFVINYQGLVGLREKGKWWKVIDNHTCFLADTLIEGTFHAVREWVRTSGFSFYDRKTHIGLLRYVVIRSTTLGQVMVNIITSAPHNVAEEKKIVDALTELAYTMKVASFIWSVNTTINDVSFGDNTRVIAGNGYIEENIQGIRYRITPNAFFQTNPYGASVMMDIVKQFTGDVSKKVVMDLYCGSGFFSLAFAKKMIGVEVSQEAIAEAQVNAQINGASVEFFAAPTEHFNWMEYNPDIVIVDPPRAGLHPQALQDILTFQPRKLIYVSCGYKNFAREMKEFSKYYRVSAIKALDMFPHTPHVELITLLERR